MSAKNIWLLAFLMTALVFGGLASTADALTLIDDIKVEAHDADNEPDNQYGIQLVRITVEGQPVSYTHLTLPTN